MSATEFTATKVEMDDIPLDGQAADVKGRFEAIYGAEPETRNGWFHPSDWPRAAYVLGRMDPGERALDVGVGAGQFLNMVALSGRYAEVAGLDRARFSKYQEFSEIITRTNGSIDELPYPDNHFDVVTCMEVLEHLPPEVFVAGLAELRRVCRGQLLMTVPFEEPEPLSKTHLRRFERTDIVEIFPDGRFTILGRRRKPWVLIEERFDGAPFATLNEPLFDGANAATPAPPKKPAAVAAPVAAKKPAAPAKKASPPLTTTGRAVRWARRHAPAPVRAVARRVRGLLR
ncbi:MAG: class I SAM-dependent methyltransferase [Actinobacteria bacterium]|nr:class I SAM-dependent methyltransferase [Actinomycetota bacterium]